jgi:hypothetical protein
MQTQKITDRIKTFNDVLEVLGDVITENQKLLLDYNGNDDLMLAAQAHLKVSLIAKAYNEGTVLDPMNERQYKYYPWHVIDSTSGFGLSYYFYGFWFSYSTVGVRLCFKSAELAIDAGKKFIEIYAQLKIK